MPRLNMRLLIAHLETRFREQLWRSYSANMLYNIAGGLFGANNGLKSYTEIMNDMDAKKPKEPEESAAEIKNKILKYLKNGGEIV